MVTYQKIIISLCAAMLTCKSSVAQEKNTLGSWNALKVKADLNNKWSVYSEFQLRSLSFYNRFYYDEFKAGLTYSVTPSFNITAGTGFYNTFKEGVDYDNYSIQKEFRLWEQFVLEQKLAFVEVEHRARIEQRFKDKYANRFRYRLNLSVPLNKKETGPKTLFASVYDEVFFVDESPAFSRNRSFAGLGYIFSEHFSLQSGWLRQIDFYQDWKRRKNYLMMSVSYDL